MMSDQNSTSSTWDVTSLESNPFLQEKPSPADPKFSTNILQLFHTRLLRNLGGWRLVVIYGYTGASFALICNIAILIWAATKPKSISDTFVLYDGDCEHTKSIITWAHLGINIFSTLILASSNYAMQILMAPTRDVVNSAHERQRYVLGALIGTWLMREKFCRYRRTQLHELDLYESSEATTIPRLVSNFNPISYNVSLLRNSYRYTITNSASNNSVIFDTTSAVDFEIYVATNDFFQYVQTHNATPYPFLDGYSVWKGISPKNWDNLTKEDCCNTFSAYYIHDYAKVVLVTNAAWMYDIPHESANITQSSQQSSGSSWLNCSSSHIPNAVSAKDWSISTSDTSVSVQYCMAEPIKPSCTVELSPQLLGVVITCNMIKVIILISLLFFKFTPLVTIGDAIASFIDEPDSITKDWGAISASELRKCSSSSSESALFYSLGLSARWISTGTHKNCRKQPWSDRKPRYSLGATLLHWIWTLLLCYSYLMFGIAIALKTGSVDSPEDIQSVWKDGLGSIVPQRLVSWHLGFFSTIIIINLPQLLLSVIYLSYNSLLTSMLLSQEWTNYAHSRKSLRVTKPKGEQRSTYFLSLPYKFSVPLLIASALLHWSVSQSIFFAQINYVDSNGLPKPSLSVLSAGYSIIGLLIALPIGAIMTFALLILGLRHYQSGIPLVISDSRAISAACHSMTGTSKEKRMSLEKLQYGVIADLGQGRYHVGFSSGPVKPLQEGRFYSYRDLLKNSSVSRVAL